jgi:signal transduction histidine kinase
MEDEAGHLWLTTNNGLARFAPDSETFKIYDRSNGLQSNEFNANAYFRSATGEIYVGGGQGFNIFSPADIQSNPTPPPVVVTRFLVLNEPYEADLTGQSPIQLNYDQNFVSFEFAALDFSAPQKNQFAYQLEGIDPDWITAGARPFASYTNLPGGAYTFRVKAANSDGVWNEEGIALPLVVTPPFWETRAFQITVIVFLGGLVALWFQWRVRSLRERSRELETSVQERTQALQETNLLLTEQIEQRQRAEAALAQKAAEEAVNSERTRLAHEFHDAVTQTLFSASLIAEVLPDLWRIDADEAVSSTDELRQLTRGALAEMRTLLLELRPAALTQARLTDLLQQLTEATVGRARLPIDLDIEGERTLPPDVKIVFYRIAQESIHNIIKHARATQVTIDLQLSPTGAHLEITDNGSGFDPKKIKPTSLGVRIMGERAEKIGADFQVQSTLGEGTTISLTWYDSPISSESAI